MKILRGKAKDVALVNKLMHRMDIELDQMMQLIYILNLTKEEKFQCVEALKIIGLKNQELGDCEHDDLKESIRLKRLRSEYKKRGL